MTTSIAGERRRKGAAREGDATRDSGALRELAASGLTELVGGPILGSVEPDRKFSDESRIINLFALGT